MNKKSFIDSNLMAYILTFMISFGAAFIILLLLNWEVFESLMASGIFGMCCVLPVFLRINRNMLYTKDRIKIAGICGGLLIGISILFSMYNLL